MLKTPSFIYGDANSRPSIFWESAKFINPHRSPWHWKMALSARNVSNTSGQFNKCLLNPAKSLDQYIECIQLLEL